MIGLPSTLPELRKAEQEADFALEAIKKLFLDKKKELTEIENQLIIAREYKKTISEELGSREKNNQYYLNIDEKRLEEIAQFKERLPSLLSKIEKEPKLKYLSIADLTKPT